VGVVVRSKWEIVFAAGNALIASRDSVLATWRILLTARRVVLEKVH
jgi:hypothetical protein